MKMVKIPPNIDGILSKMTSTREGLEKLYFKQEPISDSGKYLHWDRFRHYQPPEGITTKEWWAMTKSARRELYKYVPFMGKNRNNFCYCFIDRIQNDIQWIEQRARGIQIDVAIADPRINPKIAETYLSQMVILEAISSSQLEGASTTTQKAKEMIYKKRKPKTKDERMILNNYKAMQFILENKRAPLTPTFLLKLHKILTRDTLDDPKDEGSFRERDDIVIGDRITDEIYHEPPPSGEINKRISLLCGFANHEDPDTFFPPILKGIILHFMVGYDHPFVDGNGRVARALFFWMAEKKGYNLIKYSPVSKFIKDGPAKYYRSFLYTETDENDLTYFIAHQIWLIKRGINNLYLYLDGRLKEIRKIDALLSQTDHFETSINDRQKMLLRDALKNPQRVYTIREHQTYHGVAYETARRDLFDLADKFGFINKRKRGKTFIFEAPGDIEDKIKKRRE